MLNRFYLLVLFLSSLVLIAYTVFVTYQEITPEWKKYQVEYKELLIKEAKDENIRKKVKSQFYT